MTESPLASPDLRILEAYLESDRSPPGTMTLSGLDGFLAGIAIGPELVVPSEWLPVVWDGDEPVYADGAEANAILEAILGRYNDIVRGVADGSYRAIFFEDTDGTMLAELWAEGFVTAIGLRLDAWAPLLKSKRHVLLAYPILGLCDDESGQPALGFDLKVQHQLSHEAPQLIPPCVQAIAEFWRSRRDTLSRRDRVRIAAPRPGRNDPCPCGSGKKYKRCCGQAA